VGTGASLRCRRIRVTIASWVMAAMMRSEPRRQKGHVAISRSNTLQQSRPAPSRRLYTGITSIPALLARRRDDHSTQRTVRRQTPAIADQVHAGQRHQGYQLLQKFHRRPFDAGRAVSPRLREGVDEVPTGIFLQALKRHRTPGRVADEALKLISPMCWDLGVGMQRKPVDTDTAARQTSGGATAPRCQCQCPLTRSTWSHYNGYSTL